MPSDPAKASPLVFRKLATVKVYDPLVTNDVLQMKRKRLFWTPYSRGKMELFMKIVNGFQQVSLSIYDPFMDTKFWKVKTHMVPNI